MTAQALPNLCNIHASQNPKACLKGEKISIKIFEDGSLSQRVPRQFTCCILRQESLNFGSKKCPWSMVSSSKCYFKFIFSSLDDLSTIRSIWSWNFSSGLLKTFSWTACFNMSHREENDCLSMGSYLWTFPWILVVWNLV